MQTERIKQAISWCLTIICMAVIFWLSSRTATESSEQSNVILEWLIAHFGDGVFTDFIVRKLAHCLEFTGLCFLMNISLYTTTKKHSPVLSVIFTSIYAATDEIHQIFVEGRSCELRDWGIDTAGAVCGTIGFLVILAVIQRIGKRKKIDTVNN